MARPPANLPQTPGLPRLTEWPEAPEEFEAGERKAWARLGRAVMAGPGITEADLLMAETLARVIARLDQADKLTVFASLARLKKEMEIQLGLSPAARKNLAAPDANAEARSEAEGKLAE